MRVKLQVAALALAGLLSACGGGGSAGEAGGPTSSTSAPPPDDRVTLAQYQAGRIAAPTPMPAVAQQASDFRFATAPFAANVSGNSLLLPSLDQSRRALLLSAAQGETLAELLALPADPQGLAAGVQERELVAAPGARFRPGFLRDSDRGSAHAQAPLRWSYREDASAPSLEIHDRILQELRWPEPPVRFDGVFEADDGERRLKPMWRVAGPVWRLDEAQFAARGLRLADGVQLIALYPRQGGLGAFLQSGLDEALLQLHQRLRAGIAATPGHWVLADGSPEFSNLHEAASLGRAGDPARAQLGALNGAAHVAELRSPSVGLSWDANGLRFGGGQGLRFFALRADGSYGLVVQVVQRDLGDLWLNQPVCPPGEPDLKPMVLLALDAQHRLLMLARVGSQGESGWLCPR